MTDSEWEALREKKRLLCKNGDLKCGPDSIPFTIGKDGVPWTWYGRCWVEQMQAIVQNPKFKASVKLAKEIFKPK